MQLRFWSLGMLGSLLVVGWARGEPEAISVAGSDHVESVVRTFEGRGAMADGSSPTAPVTALAEFRPVQGVAVDLVLAEPMIEQPRAS